MLLILVLLIFTLIFGSTSYIVPEITRESLLNNPRCPNIEMNDLFNGAKDKNKCGFCGQYDIICFLDASFLTNQSNEWDKKLLEKLKDNVNTVNGKCSVYKYYYYGRTNNNEIANSNNCKYYLMTLMKSIDGTSPRCLYDNVFKSQNYAICV